MYTFFILLIVIIIIIVYEFRLRKPDEVVLFESSGEIKKRSGRFYPRHFSLAVSASAHFRKMSVEADAAGKLGVRIALAFSAAMDKTRLSELIRVGGWQKKCVDNAVDEAQVLVESQIKELTEWA